MEATTLEKKRVKNVQALLDDIILDVTWSNISRQYFGKSASWIYNKLNGKDSNGVDGGFTYAERLQLQNALLDFSERIRTAAYAVDF